ncbi:MFS transporter [Pseudomonas sp. RW4S2]|uniref:MFS transporter n=1 Tax=Pseudomonas vlassakiae TaxID=485888 RepID=A0A923GIW9_9PSED|nr:MFS transporter [Pseudomonas vlassakiae]
MRKLASEPTYKNPGLILATASAVCALIILDTNIVAVSLPTIARELNATLTDIEWVVSAYLLSFAALLLPAGSLADRFGRKRTLQIGLTIFAAASAACAAAPTLLLLDVARAFKGVGAALLLTSALASIGHCFPNEPARAKAWAFWGTTMGIVITSAPLLGGLITTTIGWRWIFWLNVPVSLLLMWAVHRLIPESGNKKASRLDPVGALLFSASLACIMWGLIEANRAGWQSTATTLRLTAGLLLMVLFVIFEKRHPRPMVDFDLMKHARFNAALLGMFSYAACAQVMMTLLPFYLQAGLGFSAITSGLGMLPFALAMFLMPRVGAYLPKNIHPATIMSIGLLLVGLGNVVCAMVATSGSYLLFAMASTVLGAGAGLLNGDTQKNIMACIPPDRLGMGSGMSTTMRFSAISLAIGVYGALLVVFTRDALKDSLRTIAPQLSLEAERLALSTAAGDLHSALETIPEASKAVVRVAAELAFMQGFSQMLFVAGILGMLAALIVGIYLRRPLPNSGVMPTLNMKPNQ